MSFSLKRQLIDFHCSLCDSKSSQIFQNLLSILVELNNAAVLMVSARPLISNDPCPVFNPLKIVLSAQITIGIPSLSYSIDFSVLCRGSSFCLFFYFL